MSKMSKLKAFLKQLAKIAPMILAVTPLAPLSPIIVAAIAEAEQIKGASGPEKLTHVVNLAVEGANAANVAAGHQVVDPAAVATAAGSVISAVVDVVNLADKKVA